MQYAILENGKGFNYPSLTVAATNFYMLRLEIEAARRRGVRWPEPWLIQLVAVDQYGTQQNIDEFRF